MLLIDEILDATRVYTQAEQVANDEHLDEVEHELALRHLAHAKVALQEAFDDYIDTRVRQEIVQREMTRT